MRGIATAAAIGVLLAACATQSPPATDTPAGEATATASPTTSASPEATDDQTAAATRTAPATATATPFGAAVFGDPDSCEHSSGAYRVAFPDAWWYNLEYEHDQLGEIAECRFFAPEAFDIDTADRQQPVPHGVAITIDYLEGGCFGYFSEILEQREITVDGHQGRVEELTRGPADSDEPHYYHYLIDLRPDVPCESPESAYITAGTSRERAGDYEDNKALLDRMMQTMDIPEP